MTSNISLPNSFSTKKQQEDKICLVPQLAHAITYTVQPQ